MSRDTVVNFHQAFSTCSCSTLQPCAQVRQRCRVSNARQTSLSPLRPNWPQPPISAHNHATAHWFKLFTLSKTLCHFFSYNTRNGFGKLVEYPAGGGCKYHLSWRVFLSGALTHGTKSQCDVVGCRDRCIGLSDLWKCIFAFYILEGKDLTCFVSNIHGDWVDLLLFNQWITCVISSHADGKNYTVNLIYCEGPCNLAACNFSTHPNLLGNTFTDILNFYLCVCELICIDIALYWCIQIFY